MLVHYTSCSELEDLPLLHGNSPLDPPVYFPSNPWSDVTPERFKIDSAAESLFHPLAQMGVRCRLVPGVTSFRCQTSDKIGGPSRWGNNAGGVGFHRETRRVWRPQEVQAASIAGSTGSAQKSPPSTRR